MPLLLIIHGHPSTDSMAQSHTDLAKQVGEAKNYEVKVIRSIDYGKVGHVMKEGYPKEYDEASDLITKADKIIITFPMWNFSIPGSLKNFFDGSIQARKHFHFKKIKMLNIGVPIGHLKTKKIISLYTADGPKWYYRIPLMNMDGAKKQIKELFKMCGVPGYRMRFFMLGQCTHGSEDRRKKWLQKLEKKLQKQL